MKQSPSAVIKAQKYREGAEGMITWCNDHVLLPIFPPGLDIPRWTKMSEFPSKPNPATGKSYLGLWEKQQGVLREALRMKNGRFIYTLIILCWNRGEGKSLLACLIQLWKFFCFPRQLITLGANSKDQVKFVHYDIMRDIITNSPKLLSIVGEKNLQEKEIRIKNSSGKVVSTVRSISSFSGIVSNITGYTFSEVFDMKNPKFFEQLDGSVRNTPNALGVIDSTVSDLSHFLYHLYLESIAGKMETLFFSYRCSPRADPMDFWNPMMDKKQLNDYKIKMAFGGGFAKYFQNLWGAGSGHVFTAEQIEEISYFGVDGGSLNHTEIADAIKKKKGLHATVDIVAKKGLPSGVVETKEKIEILNDRFTPISSVYSMINKYHDPVMPSMDELERLGDLLDTNWIILAGADMADPLGKRSGARSILTIAAKGLPGSRSNIVGMAAAAPQFVYFLLHLVVAKDKSLDNLKEEADNAHEEYDGIDAFTIEQYYALDLKNWCEERDIGCEVVYPVYGRQKEAFNLYYETVKHGRFKAPFVGVPGSKKPDIFREEMGVFDSDEDKKWFGSLEKKEVRGVQDDSQYSMAWCIYGGRTLGVDDLRIRRGKTSFGEIFHESHLQGLY